MKRFHVSMLASIVALTAFLALAPTLAFAQGIGLPGDYSTLFSGMGQSFFAPLQYLASKLYVALFLIELVVVGVQGMLYKDNVAEFLQTFAFKVLMAGVMLAVIANAGSIFPVIVQMFQQTAITTANAGGGTGLCGSVGVGNPTCLEGNMLVWSLQYFIAADASRAADSAEATAAGIVVFGTGLPGLSTAFLMGHENFALFCIALGMTCVMSAAGIFLTYTLLTFETQIIMAIGVIFLAFQGSRFTAQFAQGYMSYAINIGTKFFVFYFMVAILGQITSDGDGSLGASIASLVAGAIIPFGAGSIVLVAISSPIPVICVVSSILVAAIPNFAGSLLSGSSALSASTAMGNIAGSLASAGAMSKGMGQQQAAGQKAGDAKGAQGELAGGGGDGGGAGRDVETPQQPVDVSDQFATSGVGGGGGGGGEDAGDINPNSGSASIPVGSISSPGSQNGGSSGSSGSYGGSSGSSDGADSAASVGTDAAVADYALSSNGSGSYDDTSYDDAGSGDEDDPYRDDSEDGSDVAADDAQGSGDSSDSSDSNDSNDSEIQKEDDTVAAEPQRSYDTSQPAGRPLDQRTPEQISEMSPDQVYNSAMNSDWNNLNDDQKQAIMDNPDSRAAAAAAYKEKGEAAIKDFKSHSTDMLSSLSGFVPRADPPPPAVQVRVTNPDKL